MLIVSIPKQHASTCCYNVKLLSQSLKNTMLKDFWLEANYSLVSADVMALAAMSLSADVPAELFEGNTVAEMSL